jgi:hypothetical protein
MLTRVQSDVVEAHVRLGQASLGNPPSTFLYGPSGSGRRMAVQALAEQLRLELVEVNVGGAPHLVRQALFGLDSPSGSDGVLGGVESADETIVLYLSGLESVDPTLHQELHRVVSAGKYVDGSGQTASVFPGAWIVGGLEVVGNGRKSVHVDQQHWLCTAFRHSFAVSVCDDPKSLWQIFVSTAEEFGREIDAGSRDEILALVRRAPDGLRAVKRWVTNACVGSESGVPISHEELLAQVFSELAPCLSGLKYRGEEVTLTAFSAWADQFGSQKSYALMIVRAIAESYFIDAREFHQALDAIIKGFNIQPFSRVVFCKWQAEGKSAPRIAHTLRTQANWRVEGESVDLSQECPGSELDASEEYDLIIVDDFVGSGDTLGALFDGEDAPVARLLRALPRARLRVGVIAGFIGALQRVMELGSEFGDRVHIVPARVLDEADRCFTEESRICVGSNEQEELKSFCLGAAKSYFPGLRSKHRLGFNGVGALVVFGDTVPNNSLPILWHDTDKWRPLFPASGLPASIDGG